MKQTTAIMMVVLVTALAGMGFWFITHHERQENKKGLPPSSTTVAKATMPTTASGSNSARPSLHLDMRRPGWGDDRVQELERLGHIPEHPQGYDYILGMWCSWWGKPIDTATFWSNRVIWFSKEYGFEANRFGRIFPPPPFNDPSIKTNADDGMPNKLTEDDKRMASTGIYIGTAAEKKFWSKWSRRLPRNPADIEEELQSVVNAIYSERADRNDPDMIRRFPAMLNHPAPSLSVDTRQGFPPELNTSNVYQSVRIQSMRRKYLERLQRGLEQPGQISDEYRKIVQVDPQLVLRDPTPEEQSQYDAWKYDYLDRLRREGWDEMYVAAYAKAWKLDTAKLKAAPVPPRDPDAPPVPPAVWEKATGQKWQWNVGP